MPGLRAGCLLTLLVSVVVPGSPARAVDAFDGLIQAHGFVETQLRAIDRDFQEQIDLAQWYNVLNVEVDLDIAPEGFGPFDIFTGFVRVEARYDCVYSNGCELFDSVNTYGNDSERLPDRLSDARDPNFSGVIPPLPLEGGRPRHPFPTPVGFDPPRDAAGKPITDSGAPGFDTLFRQAGADALPNTADDPAKYTFGPVLDWRFGLFDVRDQQAGGTRAIGPFLPKNSIVTRGALKDLANPFRGRFTPTRGERFHQLDTAAALGDPLRRTDFLRQEAAGLLDNLDPRLFDLAMDPSPVMNSAGMASGAVFSDFFPSVAAVAASPRPDLVGRIFGGDWNPITPCQKPTLTVGRPAQEQIRGDQNFAFCIPDGMRNDPVDDSAGGTGSNVRIVGGGGELPMRPGPDIGIFGSPADPSTPDSAVAQGLYYPSAGLREVVASGELDDPNVNLDELNRSLNRGQSQRDEKELKEAYVDIEVFDSRLWARLGKQTIVWGKTELFPTTDVINPRDFAISSLPNLEESRIALWAGRFVYSFYDVWKFNDVRAEFAVNWDEYQPNDLGSCGEPYTLDVACQAHFGMAAHGLLGVGVAGVDRPEDPWDDLSDLEFGGRLEWRWDRFSFALVDFVGYDDLPYLKSVFSYDRNVDPMTGRPRIAGSTAPCTAGFANVVASVQNSMTLAGVGTDPACLKGGGAPGYPNENRFRQAPDTDGDGLPNPEAVVDLIGLGGQLVSMNPFAADRTRESVDLNGDGLPDDLDGDGEPDFFGFGSTDPRRDTMANPLARDENRGLSPENALENHYANQQFLAVICSATVGIASQLDPTACAFNIFTTPAPILQSGGFSDFIFSETLSATFAGEPDLALFRFLNLAVSTANGASLDETQGIIPYRALNRDSRLIFDPGAVGVPAALDRGPGRYGDGVNAHTNTASFNRTPFCLQGIPGSNPNPNCLPDFGQDPIDWLSLDSTLTNEQRALIGCGPFFGTRCDSSNRRPDPLDPTAPDTFGFGGGVDFLNMEASVLVQSWPGFEGTNSPGWNGYTGGLWTTTDKALIQPGTVGRNGAGDYVSFDGGPVATRYDPATGRTVMLPGSRGVITPDGYAAAGMDRYTPAISLIDDGLPTARIEVTFQDSYEPMIDGCPFGASIGGIPVVGRRANGDAVDLGHCGSSADSVPGTVVVESSTRFRRTQSGGVDIPNSSVRGGGNPQVESNVNDLLTDPNLGQQVRMIDGSQTLFHPLAGCFADPTGADAGRLCGDIVTIGAPGNPAAVGLERDYEAEFLAGMRGTDGATDRIALPFQSEMAAFSWNVLTFLVITSCSGDTDGRVGTAEREAKPECFTTGELVPGDPDSKKEMQPDRCGFAAPHLCRNVQAFLNVGGVSSRRIEAGGNGRFGRRTFAWQSGQEVVLKYDRRNIIGFSMDFAEDVTKSNWSLESTWIPDVPFADWGKFDGLSRSDTFNLTVSVDRPTFINFLNPNRTFFINSQWFFQYIPEHEDTFTANGPLNVLFTVAVFTGYYQDRLIPNFISVYDFQSQSGAILPSVRYRFTEAFSVDWGFQFFWGRTRLQEMPINTIGPAANRAGVAAYDAPVENALSLFRKRDEVFLRLRYTF